MGDYEYQPLDLQKPSFRLLRLHKFQVNEIECELFPASFADGGYVPYEALSYAWGSTELVECIHLNQKTLWITDNLHSALQRLRLPDRDRILWIDAICIDQTNIEERGQQVRQMGKVFSLAQNVIFWLGKATAEINVLMDCLHKLEMESTNQDFAGLKAEDERWVSLWSTLQPVMRAQYPNLEARQRTGLQALLQRPWFWRVWILQEVANASSAIVCVGAKSISAHIFVLSTSLIGVIPEPHCQSVMSAMPGPSRMDSWWGQNRDLFTLLLNFQKYSATDERDKIYALLGISSDPRDHQHLSVDYTIPVEEVTQVVMSYLIEVVHVDVHKILDLMTNFSSVTTVYTVLLHDKKSKETFKWLLQQENSVQKPHGNDHISSPDSRISRGAPLLTFERRRNTLLDDSDTSHDEVAKLLLRKGNTIDYNSINNLQAISWGHLEQNVKLLVIIGDTDKILISAHGDGYDRIVNLILDKSVYLYPHGNLHDAALILASEGGQKQLVRLLLDKGANVNAKGGNYGFALQAAANFGRDPQALQIVQLLLERGADVNEQGGYYGNTIHAAAWNGSLELMQFLLEHGVDVNTQVPEYGDLLQLASYRGQELMISLLLSRNIDINARGGKYGTALQAACCVGLMPIVELLLSHGLDINAQGGRYGTALQAASWAHPGHRNDGGLHEDVVELLLSKDADVNAEGGMYGSALIAAVNGHNHNIISQLLLKGARTTVTDGHGWTPLDHAIRLRDPHMIQTLQSVQQRVSGIQSRCLPPTSLSACVKPSSVIITGDKSGVSVTADKISWKELKDRIQLRANHPLIIGVQVAYFEVHILMADIGSVIGVGVCRKDSTKTGMPGWRRGSWAYHGDDGNCFDGIMYQGEAARGYKYGDKYAAGDIVGCGLDYHKGELFFTSNGARLAKVGAVPKGQLFPVVGIGSEGVHFSCNFGLQPFAYKHSYETDMAV